MFPIKKDFTKLDHDIFHSLTIKKKIQSGKCFRNAYYCNLEKAEQCQMHLFNLGFKELQSFFVHFMKNHKNKLDEFLVEWLFNNLVDSNEISVSSIISNYIKINIFPKYETEKEKRETVNFNIKSKEENDVIDLKSVDLSSLNQVILENGIYEHLPINKISSTSHIDFLTSFMKLGFQLGRSTDISVNDFLKICNDIVIPRSLIQKVGNDYFQSSISYFKGSMAAFEIDAGKVNDIEILVFVLTAKNRYKFSILFDLEFNFEGNLDAYQKVVYSKIQKAKENQINIVGLTTDNLPVQIQALCQDSPDSIQNNFKEMENIIHFRCTNHLLNLSYKDWIEEKNNLSQYEAKIKKIITVLSKKEFLKNISKKIPKICITRWNSAFRALEMIFILRKDIIELFQNPEKEKIKYLLEIKDDIKYIFSTGFLEVYPLLFHFASMMDYLQKDIISCVDTIVIIEYFLNKIKNNIIKYDISPDGKKLYKFIKNRLILNKNN